LDLVCRIPAAGTNSVYGGVGNDTVYGGTGNESFYGGTGDDRIYGGSGNDRLQGDGGTDTLSGDAGADLIFGGSGNFIYGGDDSDYIDIGTTWTNAADSRTATITVDGGTGGVDNDTLDLTEYTAYQNLTVSNDADGDSISGSVQVQSAYGWTTVNFTEIETLLVTNGGTTETITAVTLDGTVSGTAGNDYIDVNYTGDPDGDRVDANDALLAGHSGNDDLIDAGAGTDSVFSGAGNDTLYGGADRDFLYGGDGNDLFYGGDEVGAGDNMFGGTGDNTAYGGTGNDQYWITVGGDNTFYGGDGEDFAILESLDGPFSAFNLTLTGNNAGTANYANGDVFTFDSVEKIQGSDGDDIYVTTASTGGIWINATEGNDTLYGGVGSETLYGGIGNDVMYGGDGLGRDILFGDDNNDIIYSGDGDAIVYGGAGDDTFVDYYGTAQDHTFYGGDGYDQVSLHPLEGPTTTILTGDGSGTTTTDPGGSLTFESVEVIFGSNLEDTFDGTASGTALNFSAKAGNDSLVGGSGSDRLYGGTGNDGISGGLGADSVYGDDGNDTITFAHGDLASGGAGDDLFVLQDLGEGPGATITITGADTGETLGGGDTLHDQLCHSVYGSDPFLPH